MKEKSGLIIGVVVAAVSDITLGSLLETVVMAFVGGALGALGSLLVSWIKKKYFTKQKKQ